MKLLFSFFKSADASDGCKELHFYVVVVVRVVVLVIEAEVIIIGITC